MECDHKYEKEEDIPSNYRNLFTYNERAKAYLMTQVNGLATDQDVKNLKEDLNKSRLDVEAEKEKNRKWHSLNLDFETTQKRLSQWDEWKIQIESDGSDVEETANRLADEKNRKYKSKLDGTVEFLKKQNKEKQDQIDSLQGQIDQSSLQRHLTEAGNKANVRADAISDLYNILGGNFKKTTIDDQTQWVDSHGNSILEHLQGLQQTGEKKFLFQDAQGSGSVGNTHNKTSVVAEGIRIRKGGNKTAFANWGRDKTKEQIQLAIEGAKS